jgi:hypothetical protein
MRSLKAVLIVLGLMSLAACSTIAPTLSSQAYQDYVSDQHQDPDTLMNTHGW